MRRYPVIPAKSFPIDAPFDAEERTKGCAGKKMLNTRTCVGGTAGGRRSGPDRPIRSFAPNGHPVRMFVPRGM